MVRNRTCLIVGIGLLCACSLATAQQLDDPINTGLRTNPSATNNAGSGVDGLPTTSGSAFGPLYEIDLNDICLNCGEKVAATEIHNGRCPKCGALWEGNVEETIGDEEMAAATQTPPDNPGSVMFDGRSILLLGIGILIGAAMGMCLAFALLPVMVRSRRKRRHASHR